MSYMKQEQYLYRITQLLSRFREQVKILSSNSEFNINIHAENALIKILNKLYDCDLENVNYTEGKTYPSIDLRDKNKGVAFQITSTANLTKIKDTLKEFVKNKLYIEYTELYVFIITDKQKKYSQDSIDEATEGLFKFEVKNILDKTDLYVKLNKKNNLVIIEEIHNLLEAQFSDTKIYDKWNHYSRGLEEYDEYIQNKFQYLDIKGFSPRVNNRQVRISLDNIYVPLSFKSEYDSIEQNKVIPEEILHNSTLEELISKNNRIVVLGDPGSGKSTVLRYFMYSICKNRKGNFLNSNLMPVYIRIADYARFYEKEQRPISEYIIDYFEKKYEKTLAEALESSEIIILFDGLDEINNVNLRHDVVNEVNSFISMYPTNKIVVTSRKVGYSETRLNGNFKHYEVQDFNKKQIEEFTRNWYLSIANDTDDDIKQSKVKAKALIQSISGNKSVIRLAKNPLLVTIIALIDYQGTSLPEKRAELYDIATSTFLENWVKQRNSARNLGFSKGDLIEMLSPIAYYMHERYLDGLIREPKLRELLTRSYDDIYKPASKRERIKEVNEIINFIREDAGFIFEKGFNKDSVSLFGFVHLTFQEYFASIELTALWKEDNFSEKIKDYVFNINWHEVLLLAASQFKLTDNSRIGRKNATDFIKDITQVEDIFPELCRPYIVAIRALIDEVEIYIEEFKEIIYTVFRNIATNENSLKNTKRREHNFRYEHLFMRLLSTRNYGNKLLEIITRELDNNDNKLLLEVLIDTLMNLSDRNDIKKILIKQMNNGKFNVRYNIFNYNFIYPVHKIIHSEEYKEAILDFINTNEFIESDYPIPVQYYYSLIPEDIVLGEAHYYRRIQICLEGIKKIRSPKVQHSFIKMSINAFAWGASIYIEEYVSALKDELKHLNFERHNKLLEVYILRDSNRYSNILEYDDINIYLDRNSKELILKKNNKETRFSYPLKIKEKITNIVIENNSELIHYLNLIYPTLIDNKKRIIIESISDANLFMKFSKSVHIHNFDIKTKGDIINIILEDIKEDLFNNYFEYILSSYRDVKGGKIHLRSKFKNKSYIKKIRSSILKDYNKLLILGIVGEKEDYEQYLYSTIELYRITNDDSLKKKYYNLIESLI